jgi:ribosome biogenesis protein Tsr3
VALDSSWVRVALFLRDEAKRAIVRETLPVNLAAMNVYYGELEALNSSAMGLAATRPAKARKAISREIAFA